MFANHPDLFPLQISLIYHIKSQQKRSLSIAWYTMHTLNINKSENDWNRHIKFITCKKKKKHGIPQYLLTKVDNSNKSVFKKERDWISFDVITLTLRGKLESIPCLSWTGDKQINNPFPKSSHTLKKTWKFLMTCFWNDTWNFR